MQDNQFNQAIRGHTNHMVWYNRHVYYYIMYMCWRSNFISSLNFIILCFKTIIIYFYDQKQTERKKTFSHLREKSTGNFATFDLYCRLHNLCQSWKMKFLNFMTLQVFHDPYEPYIVHRRNYDKEIYTLINLPFQMQYLWPQ